MARPIMHNCSELPWGSCCEFVILRSRKRKEKEPYNRVLEMCWIMMRYVWPALIDGDLKEEPSFSFWPALTMIRSYTMLYNIERTGSFELTCKGQMVVRYDMRRKKSDLHVMTRR
jgi:hypothetical protein